MSERASHSHYVDTIRNDVVSRLTDEHFLAFVARNPAIPKSGPLAVRSGGVIIDSAFKGSMRAAVRYLNQRGFKIELVQFTVRVPDDWDATSDDRWMRIDFETVVV